MANPSITHHSGWEQVVAITFNPSTASAAKASIMLPYQCRVLAANFSAQTAPAGDTVVIIGTSSSTSSIVSAVTLDGSENTSFTILSKVVAANESIYITQSTLSTTTTAVGGAVTLFLEIDKEANLS